MTDVVAKTAPSSQCIKQPGQCAHSPGHRGYCYSEVTISFLSARRVGSFHLVDNDRRAAKCKQVMMSASDVCHTSGVVSRFTSKESTRIVWKGKDMDLIA